MSNLYIRTNSKVQIMTSASKRVSRMFIYSFSDINDKSAEPKSITVFGRLPPPRPIYRSLCPPPVNYDSCPRANCGHGGVEAKPMNGINYTGMPPRVAGTLISCYCWFHLSIIIAFDKYSWTDLIFAFSYSCCVKQCEDVHLISNKSGRYIEHPEHDFKLE